MNQTEDIDDMSDINIAQSVGQSLEVGHQVQTQNQQNAAQTLEQQYQWLVNKQAQENNGIINEQEFESKSRTESNANEGTFRSGTKQSDQVWDDPDLIPAVTEHDDFTENQFEVREETESMIRKSHAIKQNSDMYRVLDKSIKT